MLDDSKQHSNIIKTVVILILIMTTILILFINKITTPRYLSTIELKINGLEWMAQPIGLNEQLPKNYWTFVVSQHEQEQFLDQVFEQLRKSIKSQSRVITMTPSIKQQLENIPTFSDDQIVLINANHQLVGYFKAPFDINKMILTYSSVVTHR